MQRTFRKTFQLCPEALSIPVGAAEPDSSPASSPYTGVRSDFTVEETETQRGRSCAQGHTASEQTTILDHTAASEQTTILDPSTPYPVLLLPHSTAKGMEDGIALLGYLRFHTRVWQMNFGMENRGFRVGNK